MEINMQEMREATIVSTRKKFKDKILQAVAEGQTSCYLTCDDNCPPRQVIEELLAEGLDIGYQCFHMGSWFIKAYWHDNASGRVFLRDMTEHTISSLDEMYLPSRDYR